MPDSPSKLEQFWNELKRRKVVRVIIVYAAASYVILELISIVEDPFGLPDWTISFVFVILFIGLVISVILSWIYDITPEGIEKTKPVKEVNDDTPEKPSGIHAWKIATYISIVVILGLILANIFGIRNQSGQAIIIDKSIAVIPFKSLSTDPEKQYQADAVMDAILLHLSRIEDLRVIPRTSVEQYRETGKTVTEICGELDVAYLLEGTFQKYDEQVMLIVQLITPGKETHIWAEEYQRDWKDIFAVQKEVAQTIASELHAVITPEEKQLIEKIPTHDLTAYEFYQRGREEYLKYNPLIYNTEVLERAEDLFRYALDYDSTFAQAYTGLTMIYYARNIDPSRLQKNIIDSVLIRTDIALSFDDQVEETYWIRARAYTIRGDIQKAKDNYETALNLNPNNTLALGAAGRFYIDYLNDYVRGLECLHKAASVERSSYLAVILRTLAKVYLEFGFINKADYYNQEATALDADSSQYYNLLASMGSNQGDQIKSLQYRLKVYSLDSTHSFNLRLLAKIYLDLGQFAESILYYEKFIESRNGQTGLQGYRIGYAYLKAGNEEKADYYFNDIIKRLNRENELRSFWSNLYYTYFYLTQVYAVLGEEDKAFENLRIFNQKQTIPFWMVMEIKNSPLFDNIRKKPEFQQIVRDVETKYEATREQVRQWMVENDIS